MQSKLRGEANRNITICVDSYNQGVLSGRFYCLGSSHPETTFHSLTQLLLGIEQLLNTMNFPQSFTAIRSFVPSADPNLEEASESLPKTGSLGTFVVKVLFRQHTSWQGTASWLEGKNEQPFRSALELIFLMDSALNSSREILAS